MTDKLRNIIVVVVFSLFILAISITEIISPDTAISISERRKLQQRPKLSQSELLSGNYMDSVEKYYSDQFPGRDEFRTIKAFWQFNIFRQKDNNGIYIVDGSVYKMLNDVDPGQVKLLADKVNSVYSEYLNDMKVYFATIPDKSKSIAGKNGYPETNYDYIENILENNLDERIDFLGYSVCKDLKAEDYYKTDLHWRQECLQSVVDQLGSSMGFTPAKLTEYTTETIEPFYGVYSGQSALDVGFDTITVMSSCEIDTSVVTGLEITGEKSVYDKDDLNSLDRYDVFLSGPQSIININNPNGKTGKELYIFRDSFTSSLAPLLLANYDTITLIDLRYVSSAILGQFIQFNPNADVLFLYSTEVLLNGSILK